MSKLPPPITKDSSKSDLWEEIQALRNEVKAQQLQLNEAREETKALMSQIQVMSYQMSIIRQTLSMEFR